MEPLNLFVASLNFTRAESFSAGFYKSAADCSLPLTWLRQLSESWSWDQWSKEILQWLSRPDILAVITAWWITFTVVVIIFLCLGFGPVGIVPGSLAAAFQSWMYGGFTPAGGIFATLTSMAMLGLLVPGVVILASLIASVFAIAVWALHHHNG
ncbi:hypothetical protein N7507_002751 [Penicillium longicatenatum]|nr:hypothetical protein N7507_002751 [Penicillium longicatenatum]